MTSLVNIVSFESDVVKADLERAEKIGIKVTTFD